MYIKLSLNYLESMLLFFFHSDSQIRELYGYVQSVFSVCVCAPKQLRASSPAVSAQACKPCLGPVPENWRWIYKLEINPIATQISLEISKPRSNIIRISKPVLWIGINKSYKAISRWVPPSFVLGRRNWKTQYKPTFQTLVVLCFSVQQGCSSDIWTPWENIALGSPV